MQSFGMADLERMLEQAAGSEDGTAVTNSPDTSFTELGYDSLALLELAACVQREYGVTIPDDSIQHMETPRDAVEYFEARLRAAGVA